MQEISQLIIDIVIIKAINKEYMTMNSIKDAKEFFQQSAGKWRSQRTTHHLPFRRAESGGSDITVKFLDANDEKIVAICEMHDADPQTAHMFIINPFTGKDFSMKQLFGTHPSTEKRIARLEKLKY